METEKMQGKRKGEETETGSEARLTLVHGPGRRNATVGRNYGHRHCQIFNFRHTHRRKTPEFTATPGAHAMAGKGKSSAGKSGCHACPVVSSAPERRAGQGSLITRERVVGYKERDSN